MNWLSKIAIYSIERYQKSGGGKKLLLVDCNFSPSCSEYTKECIYRFGFFQGIYLGVKRLSRCTDPNIIKPIIDPVPSSSYAKKKIMPLFSQEFIEQEDELIRKSINNLSDDDRKAYYRIIKPLIKDPDTYAALNWFFIAGLHHFYLKHWIKGCVSLSIFLFGIVLVIAGLLGPGILILLLIFIIELYALFNSQLIVQNYNLQVMKNTLTEIEKKQQKLDIS